MNVKFITLLLQHTVKQKMFQDKVTREFRCEYCPRSFSKLGSYRNHLRTHRDQMFLDETGLSREENNTTSPSQELHDYNHFLESLNNDYWREKVYKVSSINFNLTLIFMENNKQLTCIILPICDITG